MSYSDYMDSESCRKIISERLARERKPVPKTILNTEYNIDEFLEKEICAKIVNRSKYETKDKSTLLWWNNLFKELEAKHSRVSYCDVSACNIIHVSFSLLSRKGSFWRNYFQRRLLRIWKILALRYMMKRKSLLSRRNGLLIQHVNMN